MRNPLPRPNGKIFTIFKTRLGNIYFYHLLSINTVLHYNGWFQTRVIHRILPTKKYLQTIKAVPSSLCSYCYQEETIIHLLWTCPTTQSFLQKLQSWFQRNNIILPFIEELFIFNIGEQFSMVDISTILEIKYYIFSAKKLNVPLSVIALHNRLKCSFRARKYIALTNDTLNTFEKDWFKYKTLLQD